jgi:hypothetical protein
VNDNAVNEDVVRSDELTDTDRAALRWSLSINHPVGAWAVRRVRMGGSDTTRAELTIVRKDWEDAGRPAPEAPHQHRTPVVFADGSTVTGVTFVDADPYAREEIPDFGLYLDERWNPPWPHRHVAWPDFGVPTDLGDLRAALVDLLDRARRGEHVELGCWGGHGRTGTALACAAVLAGTPASGAVRWIREAYCRGAIEMPEQAQFVTKFA